MQIKKLTLSQRKIIILIFIVVSVFLVFLFLIYLPSSNTVRRIRSEFDSTENQIKEIESLMKEAKSTDEGIRLVRKKFQELNDKFPLTEEDSLKILSDLAKRTNIEIIAFSPEAKKPLLEENGAQLTIEDKICQVIFITIKMKCSYKDLVQYLQALKEDFPALITINTLKISKENTGSSTLNVILELNFYLLSQK